MLTCFWDSCDVGDGVPVLCFLFSGVVPRLRPLLLHFFHLMLNPAAAAIYELLLLQRYQCYSK